MADQTTVREDNRQDGILISYPMAAVKLWKGSLVTTNAAGFAAKAADTAAFFLAGVAYETVDNSGGSAGDVSIKLYRKGVFDFAFSGTAAQADVGKLVYAVDDQTVALAATTSNDVPVGRIVSFVSASKVRVELSPV